MYQGRTVTKTSHLPIRYFLALLWAHPVLHVSMIRVNVFRHLYGSFYLSYASIIFNSLVLSTYVFLGFWPGWPGFLLTSADKIPNSFSCFDFYTRRKTLGCVFPIMLFILEFQPRLLRWSYASAYLYSTSRWEHSPSLSIARHSNRETTLSSHSVAHFPWS